MQNNIKSFILTGVTIYTVVFSIVYIVVYL